ncbi:PBCV-specific basic adaptor domain-containing protein [Acanthocystis turfacea Chlorella virus MO0605SPH]|nr:PBCV-specific basic adaptor domain-containing protein [Acanthocystis turfacea Chlorella virus MO0605SPH]AGE60034.1 PBCV-specific basic adaptor domain-containing protein [Acanthocystis turfacea Chlorella virus WI0606]
MEKATNTGKKDAKGRAIYKGPRGGEFVKSSSGRRVKPAVGRVSSKALREKAQALSAKRVDLEKKERNLSAKRVALNEKEARAAANNVMRRLDALVSKKARDVGRAY